MAGVGGMIMCSRGVKWIGECIDMFSIGIGKDVFRSVGIGYVVGLSLSASFKEYFGACAQGSVWLGRTFRSLEVFYLPVVSEWFGE